VIPDCALCERMQFVLAWGWGEVVGVMLGDGWVLFFCFWEEQVIYVNKSTIPGLLIELYKLATVTINLLK
jgi:hypothetical protein